MGSDPVPQRGQELSNSPYIWRPSPNFGPRRDGLRPELIVIHYTAMQSAESACARLCDPQAEVSAHFLIGRDGTVTQMVAEEMRAWHAGAGSWGGAEDVNSRSIGVELDNSGDTPFAEPQMAALETLLADLMGRWDIPAQGVIGHSDMAPGRKQDPGVRFDWRRLARQGLAVWATGAIDGSEQPGGFETALAQIGYPVDHNSAEDCLLAFRMRFRPWARGGCDAQDLRCAQELAQRFGIDRGDPTA